MPLPRSLPPDRVEGRRPALPRLDRGQLLLFVAAIACYAVGYPVALAAHWAGGWVLVTLGGVLLLALAGATIRRIHRSAGSRS